MPVWLVNATEVKNVPGRPKTDKLDAVWLAKLTERGMLRPSFVPPTEIRVLRDYTRLRADLTVERSLTARVADAVPTLAAAEQTPSPVLSVHGRARRLCAGEVTPTLTKFQILESGQIGWRPRRRGIRRRSGGRRPAPRLRNGTAVPIPCPAKTLVTSTYRISM